MDRYPALFVCLSSACFVYAHVIVTSYISVGVNILKTENKVLCFVAKCYFVKTPGSLV